MAGAESEPGSAGLFITFEGPEGSGKSTQANLLGRSPGMERAVLVREPGGTGLGEEIRRLLLDFGGAVGDRAEMHLFLAARSQLVEEVIRPTLDRGGIVIADRYHDSTLAYQGGARHLEVGWPAGLPRPDVTFLLQLPAEEGMRRVAGLRPADRIESEGIEFHRAVVAAYRRLAEAEPKRFLKLDATRGIEEIQMRIRAELAALAPGRLAPTTGRRGP